MAKTTPNYLRIHRAPARNNRPSSGSKQTSDDAAQLAVQPLDSTKQLWQAFSLATGWRVQPQPSPGQLVLLPTADFAPLSEGEHLESIPAVSRSSAMQLAEVANSVTQELAETRAALRRQEAELASRAVLLGEPEQVATADAVDQTLAAAAAASGCDAAAMYLLDEDTQRLKARAVFGLPADRLTRPPRLLRGSRGDLEAMVQGVVRIDDLREATVDTWNCPEQAGAALCASISNEAVPIGTLWLLSKQAKEFTASEVSAAQLSAAQLALRLQASASLGNENSRVSSQAIRDITEWQFMGLPTSTNLADGWSVDGMIQSTQDWSVGWHTWDVLPDGTLMLAIAEAVDQSLAGAMISATSRAALTAHTGYRHTPRELMQRISDTLWQTNTGEQLVSLLYARIDPDTGEGEVASAGEITAMICSSYGYRPLMDGKTEMLTSHIDSQCEVAKFRMASGEAFLAYGPGLGSDGQSQQLLGDELRACLQQQDPHPLAAIRRALATAPAERERGAISIVRQ